MHSLAGRAQVLAQACQTECASGVPREERADAGGLAVRMG